MKESNRIFFKGIDGIRAIGALSVVLGHLELIKSEFNLPNVLKLPFYQNTSGHLGVVLFFVLSGFLITYLLLKEKEEFKSISVKQFYIRRILRIWPIYYLTLILLIGVFPLIIELDYYAKPDLNYLSQSYPTLIIFFLMAPNFMAFGIPSIGGGFHLISIGTEEQFYLFWPWILRGFKNVMIPFIIIFLGVALAPNILDFIKIHFFSKGSAIYNFLDQLRLFMEFFKIDCMALGGIFAYIYHKGNKLFLKIIFNRYTQLIALIVGLGGWIAGFSIPLFKDEFYSVFFAIIILNTAANPNKMISFDYSWLNYLGKISYGIYVYHWIIILFVLNFIIELKDSVFIFNLTLYLGSIALTILISHLSYFKFETYFLRFKYRFSRIKSNQYG